MNAPITEIFASIQGEGLFVGEKQVFVRFKDCNLKCDYCDTRNGKRARELASDRVLREIKSLNSQNAHAVSFTGGEPLLYVDFLRELLPQVKKLGLKTYLETNGTLPEELKKIIKMTNYVAMDIKLPSSGNTACWEQHREFLEVLNNSYIKPGDFFVKIVLTSRTRAVEIKKAVSIIAEVSRYIPLVLQPVSPIRSVRNIAPKNTFAFQNQALDCLATVKVIPQMHKILGVR